MLCSITHGTLFLAQKSVPATQKDRQTVIDLKNTLNANFNKIAGMAANMIGKHQNIIGVVLGTLPFIMINPQIINKEDPYIIGLSLKGKRQTKRFRKIQIKYQDENFKWNLQIFNDFIAEVIQHEIDHCNGILI